jgi:hypothetical protein
MFEAAGRAAVFRTATRHPVQPIIDSKVVDGSGVDSRSRLPTLTELPISEGASSISPESIRAASFRFWQIGKPCQSASDQFFPNRPHGRLCAIRNADLAQDVLDVFFAGFVADSQRRGDFSVGQTECQLLEDFTFSFG